MVKLTKIITKQAVSDTMCVIPIRDERTSLLPQMTSHADFVIADKVSKDLAIWGTFPTWLWGLDYPCI